jgi:hypothetical protein
LGAPECAGSEGGSALNHSDIITIDEIDQASPTPFIATEFLEGSTRRERTRGQPMPLADCSKCAEVAVMFDRA